MAVMEPTSRTRQRIKERRLERMRLGQAVCDFVELASDPEIRLAIVPLTEAEYRIVLEKVNQLGLADDLAGVQIKDRVQAEEILVRAIREEHDLQQRVYESTDDMLNELEVADIDHLLDAYQEMVFKGSPSLDEIPEEEFEALKKVLARMDWNELSGPAWYAARRFLSRITPQLRPDNSPGSSSTPSQTETTSGEEPTFDA